MESMKKWIGVSVLVVLWGIVCTKTYVGGSYLLGWDNLVPEFGFQININRALSTTWQEYQGIGLLGGMGHAADLTRQILLWGMSGVVPTNMLRWGWTLGMLLLGPLGIYALGKKFFRLDLAALVGAVFYLLNPVTVQVFNVPFETFVSFYGFVPWMLWGALTYLRDGRRASLIKLLLILLLGMSAFVVQTMFIVLLIMIGIFSLEHLVKYRDLKRVLKMWLVVLAGNLFWLLPVLWFGITSSSVNINAKMNQLATHEVELMNVAYGDIAEIASLKGWWLQNTDVNSDGKMILLMENWTKWLGGSEVQWVGIIIFITAIIGLLYLIKEDQKKKLKWSWLSILLLIFTMLARRVQIFSKIYDLIAQNVPLFGQMFRAGYTKWSIPMILVVSVGLMSIINYLYSRARVFAWVVTFLFLGMISYVSLPVFRDGMVGERMKVELPGEYSSLFKYFRTADIGRVVTMPANSIWGWQYHDWGYRGSGFLWYGIEQPILDRAFDVWSPYNEGFYNELSTAMYGADVGGVEMVLEKYDVRYVLLDESVIAPGQSQEILRISETKEMAEMLGWERVFDENFLKVWEIPVRSDLVGLPTRSDLWVSASSEYAWVEGDVSKVRRDVIYEEVGTYIEIQDITRTDLFGRLFGPEGSNPVRSGLVVKDRPRSGLVEYPFANLMREELQLVEYKDEGATVRSDLVGRELVVPGWKVGEVGQINLDDGGVPLPAYYVNGQPGPVYRGELRSKGEERYFYIEVGEGEGWGEYLEDAQFVVEGSSLEVEVRGGSFVYDFADMIPGKAVNCDVLSRGEVSRIGSRYWADNYGAVCDYVVMSELFPKLGYLMRMQGENVEGRSVKIFLHNTGSKRNDLEYLLDEGEFDQTFSLLSWSWDGHYSLNVETRSFGQYGENVLQPVEVRWFPLDVLSRAKLQITNNKLQTNSNNKTQNNLKIGEVRKTGTWMYRVEVSGNGLLALSQGYDAGWVAWSGEPFGFAQDLRHVKVNGWKNGFLVEGEQNEVVIMYWPQLLEYLGFLMLFGSVVWVWRMSPRRSRSAGSALRLKH